MKKTQINFKLENELLIDARLYASSHEMSLSELIRLALKEKLGGKK